MTSTGVAVRRSNKDVARSMLIVGCVILAVAVVMTFATNWVATFWVNGSYRWLSEFVLHAWSVGLSLAYPLGSFLIVGSIIVNRLPEQRSTELA